MSNFLIEAFGYLGSFLVLVSMLMTSVVKLRVINTIGSIIFTIYALIIRSYPTALMNAALVFINLYFLFKMTKTENHFRVVEVNSDDLMLKEFLDYCHDDIYYNFPDLEFDLKDMNRCFVVFNEDKPVGFTIGKYDKDELDLVLDYTVPAYRDASIGNFLYDKLGQFGIKKVLYKDLLLIRMSTISRRLASIKQPITITKNIKMRSYDRIFIDSVSFIDII